MWNKTGLATQALEVALKLRDKQGYGLVQVFDIVDFVSQLGIAVKFVDLPSMEAIYLKKQEPEIWVSSHRPSGRRAFNCAHELGHHVFRHGSKVDEYLDGDRESRTSSDPEEYLADRFASYLLMPKSLVSHAFRVRGWNASTCSPIEAYTVAGWLGVGYETLVYHMKSGLKLTDPSKTKELLSANPKTIRSIILGKKTSEHLTTVDLSWVDRAIDASTTDLVLVPHGTDFLGKCLEFLSQLPSGQLYKAVAPGKGRFVHQETNWAAYVRVARKGYVGQSKFRFLEDPEYEQ